MAQGLVYLVAVVDWFSRYVLSWRLSLTVELNFCVDASGCALRRRSPEIFNSDQGSQFTSEKFSIELAGREMDGSVNLANPVQTANPMQDTRSTLSAMLGC